MTDLKASLHIKKNPARLYAPCLYISALSRRVYYTNFGKFSLLILAPTDLVSLLATPPPLGHPYAPIPTPVPSPLLSRLPQ